MADMIKKFVIMIFILHLIYILYLYTDGGNKNYILKYIQGRTFLVL